MPVSNQGHWKRFAKALTLPAVTIALTASSGCRGDGGTRPSLSAMSPMRWFARGETTDAADDASVGDELQPVPGDFSTPPVPPSAPVGRAYVPSAPAPEPDAFYDVRPTSQETHETEPRPWKQTLRGWFGSEPDLKPIPADVEPVSHESAAASAYERSSGMTNLPPVPPPLFAPGASVDHNPAGIASHIEPLPAARGPERLPTIVARRFPVLPRSEPSPWPYSPAPRPRSLEPPRTMAVTHAAPPRAEFLPLPGDDTFAAPAPFPQ